MKKDVRLVELDVLRGWAVFLMILFHICYDLNYFEYVRIDIYQGAFWLYFRNSIVAIFLLCMGISLSLAHMPHIKWDKLKKRILVLGVASVLVSVTTYLVFPSAWVYFGILHFILLATLLGLFFLPYPRFSLIFYFFLFLAYTMDYINMFWLWESIDTHIITLPQHTVDFVRFIPWFSVVLIGIFMVTYRFHTKILQHNFFSISLKHNKVLEFLGKHALVIYLIHQPIFFGSLMLLES